MDVTTEYQDKARDIAAMFRDSFTVSEGPEAGQQIAALVAEMLGTVSAQDMHVFSAMEGAEVRASILFTRMRYPEDTRTVFILSPVAVAPDQQGKGVGQRLITHGLAALRESGVDIVLTYGDIAFYSKVGFTQITTEDAQPPLPLQHPHGWLGQALADTGFAPLQGPSECVPPLGDPDYW
ncbi:GNAT family N-acetyltransferase [Rhodobacterales bacterium HKCCE4037]|nr:GNAT family N-acetyltransferase [Rhodobacterales bacterium HKCCE4037]